MTTTLDLTDPGVLLPLLKRHGFHTRKGLGQHFLASREALDAIVEACAVADGLPILEIGPGIGTLTRALAEAGAAVTAVEVDAHAIIVLRETVGAFPRVQVRQADIMQTDLPALLGQATWTAVGNLPYYITTPVLGLLLEHAPSFRRIVVMVQREVADRLASPPGSKVYGALSVFAQTFAEVTRVALVSRESFVPPPTVDSAVVRLDIRPEPLASPALQPLYFAVVRAAFGQRRKTLENALAGGGILDGDRPAVRRLLEAAEIDPSRRGETLGIAEFVRVAVALEREAPGEPSEAPRPEGADSF